MDEAGPAEGHQPPTRAAPTQACWRGPFSPSKKLRLAAGRDVRVAAMALLKVEKCMPKHLDAYNVAERIYNSKKGKLRGGRSKKRGGSSIQRMHDLHMCEHEWSAAQMIWMEQVSRCMAHEESLATAELALRDEKIAMLKRRLRALRSMRRNGPLRPRSLAAN